MPRLLGMELYFRDLEGARHFYRDTLGLPISEEQPGRYAKFEGGAAFLCLERKGSESYPSEDKAVLFLEVSDLAAEVDRVGRDRIVQFGPAPSRWAVLHDPEGHNLVLMQADA